MCVYAHALNAVTSWPFVHAMLCWQVPANDPRFHELVEEYHAVFKAALLQLFDEHVAEFAPGTKIHIVA